MVRPRLIYATLVDSVLNSPLFERVAEDDGVRVFQRNLAQEVNTFDGSAVEARLLAQAKVDDKYSAILASSHDASVIRLCSKHPACGPVLGTPNLVAGLEVVDTKVKVVRARDDTVVGAVQPEGTDELGVAGELSDLASSLGLELVCDVIVTTSEDVFHVFGELDSSQSTFLCGELLDQLVGFDIPETSNTVTAGTDKELATKLNGIDRAAVAFEGACDLVGLTVPNMDLAVFATRHNVLSVESNVQDSSGVGLQTANRFKCLDVPDNKVRVRRTSYEDVLIVLQAEDACIVPVLRSVVYAVSIYCTVDTGNSAVERRVVDGAEGLGPRHWLDVGSANDLDALHRVNVPDTDGPIT